MSSKGKRSSILKKQHTAPSSVGRTDPIAPSAASSSSGYKNLRRIEFNRKKSVKEFIVGEDVDTIWGNSYEVSTDGTPSSGLEDATLGNSTCRINGTVDEQNKENCSTNPLPVDDSLRAGTIGSNTTNTSWDLSITLADDEKRKLRHETSGVFSQSLNTTERLLIEPAQLPAPGRVKVPALLVEETEVQAMDISPIKPSVVASPIKSPRKMIYNFPKQSMFVEINDVPSSGTEERASQPQGVKTPVRPSWRTGMSLAGDQTTLRGSSYNVSETWNSHPHALYQRGLSVRPSGDLANVSSDVDTTIALTNAMNQVLQSCSNESIQKATNMELDESTTTLPSNALARARPSFLPSNRRVEDGEEVRTPPQERDTLHDCTNSIDISSPVAGQTQRGSLSFENLSILAEEKQLETGRKPDARVEVPEAEMRGKGLMIDLGLSSLSLKLRPSSPELPVMTKPRILRPTLPAGLLESATKKSEPNKTMVTDVTQTPRMPLSRQNAFTGNEWQDGETFCKKSLVPMDISTDMQTSKPLVSSIQTRMTVGMETEEEDEKPSKQHTRPTVFHSTDIVIDQESGHRATIVCDERMELTTACNAPARPTIYSQEPLQDETLQIKHSTTVESMKRGTVHGTVTIEESDCASHSPQTALANYRRTVYPLDGMKEDVSIVPGRGETIRKTILSNDDMILDVCATPNAKTNSEASISCVLYGRNVDELSIHAANRSNVVDLKFGRPTSFQTELCEESTAQIERERQTLMQAENMILSDGCASQPSRHHRKTTHTEHVMGQDGSPAAHRESKSATKNPSRKSNFNAEQMELTLVEERKKLTPTGRLTTHATEVLMDESIVEENVEQADRPDHPHGEANNAEMVKKWQRSRIPRPSTHVREDMEGIVQREEPARATPRYSTYEREDMELTKLDTDVTTEEQGDRSGWKIVKDKMPLLGGQSKDQLKSRLSSYEHEDMNATKVCEDRLVESSQIEGPYKPQDLVANDKSKVVPEVLSTPTVTDRKSLEMDLTGTETIKPESHQVAYHTDPMDFKEVRATEWDNEQRHNVTNYNTFLDHYEMSHEIGHGGGTSAAAQDSQEKQFNSTRLSKAYDMVDEAQPIRSRPSTYHAEAMDETHKAGREELLAPQAANGQFDSPMHMSPVAEGPCKSKGTTRQSTYRAEEMDSTQMAEENEVQVARKPSYGFRKSNLQSIAIGSASIDMEGISVLESDEIDPRMGSEAAGTRGTIFFNAPAITEEERINETNYLPLKEEERPLVRQNNRLSIYDAAAMVEETVPLNRVILKQGLTTNPDVQESLPSGAGAMLRKSNDCMDETIVPENIRVERNVRYTRQSLARMGSSVEGSPYVCPAEALPPIGQLQAISSDTEETMELTKTVTKTYNLVQEVQRSRQTIHHPDCMELTMVGRETVTPPPLIMPATVIDRRTIYNPGAMEETPPHLTVKARSCETENPGKDTATPETHLEIGQTLRRPRQTILIPQDMDVVEDEEEEDVKPKEEQHSFALSMLPRETTEDYMPRSASLLPKRAFAQQPVTYQEFAKPNQSQQTMGFYQQQSHTIARKTVIGGDAPELSDISMSTSVLRPEIPHIGNITGMMSMREITEPTLPAASFQEHSNSVSVICRVEKETTGLGNEETVGLQTLAFVPAQSNGASDDEFYDAEGEDQPVVDPLSLTKSRHLSMKFVDVDHLEQTNCGGKGSMLPSITRSKRAHAQVLCSPIVSRAGDGDCDPLQTTNVRQTPNGPIKKRARKSCNVSSMQQISTQAAEVVEVPPEPEAKDEEVPIKEEPQTIPMLARGSMALIHDPSVFVLEGDDGDLLDDESDIACASLPEETPPDENGRPATASPRPRLSKIAELSYYKDFANLTIDSWEADAPTPKPHDNPTNGGEQTDAVEECISVSDEDSLIITPPKVPLASRVKGRLLDGILNPISRPSNEVLDSTIASEIMYHIRQQHPMVKHPCCGMPNECICPLRRELKRRQEASDLVWDRWCARFATIKQRVTGTGVSDGQERDGGEEEQGKPKTFVEQFEELNWRLLCGKFDERFLFAKGELCGEDMSRRRSRTITSGHYPETPSVAFLADNLRSFLSEQMYDVDDGPPPGATMPAIPRITQLIANKLHTDSGTRWMLDCSEEDDGLLLFRHRTLRSFVISIQVQPPRGKTATSRGTISENWRLERIQVRECQQEYIHSPKLLLAHIEFMRLAKETTEQTLRATYRSVADLMGLWHRFNEQLERIFEAVNRLLTIVRNNEALLCYDAQMERFCVKKCFHRTGDDGQIDANVLQVYFSCIGSIGAPGVGFRWPMVEPLQKLLPASTSQHSVSASNHFSNGVVVGSDHKAGLMFLECLLWNVTKQYES